MDSFSLWPPNWNQALPDFIIMSASILFAFQTNFYVTRWRRRRDQEVEDTQTDRRRHHLARTFCNDVSRADQRLLDIVLDFEKPVPVNDLIVSLATWEALGPEYLATFDQADHLSDLVQYYGLLGDLRLSLDRYAAVARLADPVAQATQTTLREHIKHRGEEASGRGKMLLKRLEQVCSAFSIPT